MTTIAVFVFVPARAATPDPACNNDFFGIPSWFNGLVGQGDNGCEFTPITYDDNGTTTFPCGHTFNNDEDLDECPFCNTDDED